MTNTKESLIMSRAVLVSREQITDDLIRVRKDICRLPTPFLYKKHGMFGYNTVRRKFGSWGKAMICVFGEAYHVREVKKLNFCKLCDKETFNKMFCSRRCSNIAHPRRKKTKSCKKCGEPIYSGRNYCKACRSNGLHLRGGSRIEERTLGDVLGKGSSRYAVVRQHACRVVREWQQKCAICTYDKKVHVCHKKAISDFSLDTKVGQINDPSNLVILCPNHHTEFDAGLLELQTGGPSRI